MKRMQSRGKKNKQQVVKEVGGCVRMRGQEERGEWREGWFAVVESRSNCAKVKAVDVMHAYLMPTWSKCECC